jgi:hypothetical protein
MEHMVVGEDGTLVSTSMVSFANNDPLFWGKFKEDVKEMVNM